LSLTVTRFLLFSWLWGRQGHEKMPNWIGTPVHRPRTTKRYSAPPLGLLYNTRTPEPQTSDGLVRSNHERARLSLLSLDVGDFDEIGLYSSLERGPTNSSAWSSEVLSLIPVLLTQHKKSGALFGLNSWRASRPSRRGRSLLPRVWCHAGVTYSPSSAAPTDCLRVNRQVPVVFHVSSPTGVNSDAVWNVPCEGTTHRPHSSIGLGLQPW